MKNFKAQVRRSSSNSGGQKGQTVIVLVVLTLVVLVLIGNLKRATEVLRMHNTTELTFESSTISSNTTNTQNQQQSFINLPNKYHVIVSVSDSKYQQWQILVFYYHYQKVKRENPNCAMGGFTRLLHSGSHDEFSQYLNTVIVSPLPSGVDKGFKPLNRPWAFVQLMQKVEFAEEYIFMAEPDQIMLHPPELWATRTRPATYPFTYMNPKQYEKVLEKYNDRQIPNFIENLFQIGNSPTMMHRDQLKIIAPIWHDLALRLKKDDEAEKAFGWVLEMYAFVLAASQFPTGPLQFQYHFELQLQPPWDNQLNQFSCFPPKATCARVPAYMIHFTYGQDTDESGKFTPGKVGFYHWDKRDYSTRFPPKKEFPLPPAGTNEVTVKLVESVNEAIMNTPYWPA